MDSKHTIHRMTLTFLFPIGVASAVSWGSINASVQPLEGTYSAGSSQTEQALEVRGNRGKYDVWYVVPNGRRTLVSHVRYQVRVVSQNGTSIVHLSLFDRKCESIEVISRRGLLEMEFLDSKQHGTLSKISNAGVENYVRYLYYVAELDRKHPGDERLRKRIQKAAPFKPPLPKCANRVAPL